MIRARHEERTSEYVAKNKFSKEIDLPERIDGQSVRSGFAVTGKLFVTAAVKSAVPAGHPPGSGQVNSAAPAAAAAATAVPSCEPVADDRDGDDQLATTLDAEELLIADARGVELMPCNVLDLASFPPTALATASQL